MTDRLHVLSVTRAVATLDPTSNHEMSYPRRYLIPAQTFRSTEEIKRSRFITTVGHAPTVEAARDFVAHTSQEFSDASHNCWAYVIGPPGSTSQIGMSDAGEPHGTAGRPMLTVLSHSGIGDICAVVTRYFGGKLLGKGGLVQAYGGGVQATIAHLPTKEKVSRLLAVLILNYSSITPIKRILPDYEAVIIEEEYGVDVTYHVEIPEEFFEPFTEVVTELTKGKVVVEQIG